MSGKQLVKISPLSTGILVIEYAAFLRGNTKQQETPFWRSADVRAYLILFGVFAIEE